MGFEEEEKRDSHRQVGNHNHHCYSHRHHNPLSTVAWRERGHQGRRVIIQIEPLAPDYPLGTPHHHHHGAHVCTTTQPPNTKTTKHPAYTNTLHIWHKEDLIDSLASPTIQSIAVPGQLLSQLLDRPQFQVPTAYPCLCSSPPTPPQPNPTAPLCLFPSPPPPPPSPTKSCCAEIFLFVPVPEFSDRRQAVCPTGGRPVITSNLFKPLLSHLEFDTNTK